MKPIPDETIVLPVAPGGIEADTVGRQQQVFSRPCPVCSGTFRILPKLHAGKAARCNACGLIAVARPRGAADAATTINHYRTVDPHAEVAASKTGFFDQALRHLDNLVQRRPRRILDVGCGHGHFIENAAARGWEAMGIEIVPEAVLSARQRAPGAVIIQGDFGTARLAAESQEALAMWDVLDHLADPGAALDGCRRVLTPGGIVGIRVRNAATQIWIHRCQIHLNWLMRRHAIKPLSVFHCTNFSRKAIERLLSLKGFVNISTLNSPLTTGAPYSHLPRDRVVGLAKILTGALSGFVYRLSSGRAVIGPSLLVWAQKPHAPVRERP